MKKMMLIGALLMLGSAVGNAQESRQDISISGFVPFSPDVYGPSIQPMTTTLTTGILASYRYMVTPRSALEVNYGFAQNTNTYRNSTLPASSPIPYRVHARDSEITAAYVYTRNYGRYNPFAEIGPGVMLFTPIRDSGTNQSPTSSNTNIGGLFGAGVAYEISPSFDIRAQYRGFFTKVPTYGLSPLSGTNAVKQYYVISMPTIGIAYHF